MLELEQALEKILATIPPATSESVPLGAASGRISAEEVRAAVDLPPFDNSSMDGFAVRAEDVALAAAERPVALQLSGRVAAGDSFAGELSPGQCIRIFTGSPLPRGADAVVMQEDTRVDLTRSGEVLVLDSVKPWENIRFRGEDVKSGTTLLRSGDPLTVGRIALLAANGVAQANVNRRPRVALLATGSELREAGAILKAGEIYESNRATLMPLIEKASGIPSVSPIVPDDPASTRNALETAFKSSDIVVTCGGVSVGELDFVKSAFEQLGGRLEFWRVAIKPGRPFVFGCLKDKFLFGLPGNPVSALVTFLLLVRPAILRWQGAKATEPSVIPGVLAEPLSNEGNRRHFVRVTVDGEGNVRSAGIQASHILSSVAEANALLDMPPQTRLEAGAVVRVIPM